MTFLAPLEDPQPTLQTLMERAWPEAPDGGIKRAFDEGRVRVENRITHNPHKRPGPAKQVDVQVELETEAWGMPEAEDLARGDGWVVVDKPEGMPGVLRRDDPMNPILYLADELGVERDGFAPAWPMPNRAGGPWPFGLAEGDADALRRAWFQGDLMTTWAVLVPRPDQPNGTLPVTEKGVEVRFSASQMRDGLAELQLTPRWVDEPPGDDIAIDAFDLVGVMLDGLAEADIPVLGDRARGGFMVEGGLHIRLAALYQPDSALQHSWSAPKGWWPEAPVAPEPTVEEDAPQQQLPRLTVVAGELEALRAEAAHPWIPADQVADATASYSPGTLVELRSPQGAAGPVALVDKTGEVAARTWSRDPLGAADFEAEVDMRVDEALAERADYLSGAAETDFYRLIHGEADGLPGFLLDRVGPVLRAHLVGGAAFGFKERVYTNLADFDPDMMVLEIDHTRPNPDGERDWVLTVRRSGAKYVDRGEPVVGRDAGLRWSVDPWDIGPRELRAARRPHRQKLAEAVAPGQTWLDLSVPGAGAGIVAAAAGAQVHTAGNDEARTWFEKLRAMNDVPDDAWHDVSRTADGWSDDPSRVDGIILDLDDTPGGDPQARLERATGRLAEGGRLLVTAHEAGLQSRLEGLVDRAVEDAERSAGDLQIIEPPADVPTLEGFPEGTPFRSVWTVLE